MLRMVAIYSEGEIVVVMNEGGLPVVLQHTCELDGEPCPDHDAHVSYLQGVVEKLTESGLTDARLVIFEEKSNG